MKELRKRGDKGEDNMNFESGLNEVRLRSRFKEREKKRGRT